MEKKPRFLSLWPKLGNVDQTPATQAGPYPTSRCEALEHKPKSGKKKPISMKQRLVPSVNWDYNVSTCWPEAHSLP